MIEDLVDATIYALSEFDLENIRELKKLLPNFSKIQDIPTEDPENLHYKNLSFTEEEIGTMLSALYDIRVKGDNDALSLLYKKLDQKYRQLSANGEPIPIVAITSNKENNGENEEDQRAYCEKFFEFTSTPWEASLGVPLAAYLIPKAANLRVEIAALDFLIRHAIPAYAAASIFVLVGSAIKYTLLYQKEKRENPALEPCEFFSKQRKNMLRFAVSLFIVGGGTFTSFSGMGELAALAKFDSASQEIFSFALGMGAFMLGNQLPHLRMPPIKLMEIAGVLGGFLLGKRLLETFNLSGTTVYDLGIPTATVFAGSLAASFFGRTITPMVVGVKAYCGSFWNSKNNQGYERHRTETIKLDPQRLIEDPVPQTNNTLINN